MTPDSSEDALWAEPRPVIAAYHDKATPFVWRKREVKSSQQQNTIVNVAIKR